MTIKLHLHGVRGSRPTHKRNLLGFGGNSTSMEFVIDDDFYLFLDGGSGLVKRGREIAQGKPRSNRYHFLITHTHWDHLLGLPFFEPLYNPNNVFTFYASQTSKATFNDLFFGLSNADNLPVPATELKASINFQTITPGSSFMIEGKIKVSTYQLNHNGVTLGYRVDRDGFSGCVITDNAPIENNYLSEGGAAKAAADPKFHENFNAGLVAFLRDAHTVVFDTHFTEKTLKPDWGHSTPERALKFCHEAGVKRLVLFHHAPEDSDEDVRKKVESVVNEGAKKNMQVVAAKEGDLWLLRSA